jgi:hypothetical protein
MRRIGSQEHRSKQKKRSFSPEHGTPQDFVALEFAKLHTGFFGGFYHRTVCGGRTERTFHRCFSRLPAKV